VNDREEQEIKKAKKNRLKINFLTKKKKKKTCFQIIRRLIIISLFFFISKSKWDAIPGRKIFVIWQLWFETNS